MEKETSKLKILRSAQALFCEKGFKGASVRAIAKEAQVNIASISYYFGGKRELYVECLQSFGKQTLVEAKKLLEGDYTPASTRNRLMIFTEHMVRKYLDNPELVQLVLKEVENSKEHAHNEAIDSLLEIFEYLKKFFEKLGENSILKPELKPEIVASLYMGALSHAICRDQVKERLTGFSLRSDNEYAQSFIEHITEVYFRGILYED